MKKLKPATKAKILGFLTSMGLFLVMLVLTLFSMKGKK